MLKFKIASARIVDEENEKKYVVYSLQVSQNTDVIDPNPINIERRYTHFYDLFSGLKKDYPNLLAKINFPKKVMIGNFDQELIVIRSNVFASLMNLIASESKLRDSPFSIQFFQDVELNEAKRLMTENKYISALQLLETNFKLLNKVYTDRSPVVIIALCWILACAASEARALAGPVERWGVLALRRYQGVSDSDLLQLYIPLLQTCIMLWEILGKDKQDLENELKDLKKLGMKVDTSITLMQAINDLEEKYLNM